jgi:O-antigen ligase
VLGAAIAVTILGVGAMQTEVMRGRVQVTTTEGSLAGREKLFPALWSMFLEKPLVGWGPQRNQYELATRAPFNEREYRDSHNLFLELLTATGVVGAVPFLVALGLCTHAAWRGRRGTHGILPFALVALFLIANLSIDMLATKPFWVALALAWASGPPAHVRA